MGNYNRILSGEFPPPPSYEAEHEALLRQLSEEIEVYLQAQNTADVTHTEANPQLTNDNKE